MHAWQTILAIALGSHLASANEWRIQAAPVITGALIPRQEQTCPEATETMCSDGTGGCCPYGSACTFISGEPRCAGGCDGGGPTCLNGGCCDAGYNCPTAGGSFCHKATNFLPAPTATLSVTSFFDPGSIETTEARTTESASEPTSTPGSTSTSEPSSTSQPSSTSEPTTTTTSSARSASPSSSQGGDTLNTASRSPEPSESSTNNDTPGAAIPETVPDMAGSLSVSWGSWMAFAVIMPFML
ncbi:hypothetical protein N7491_003939 [Penicillium cf. griseofulvum]|uniref:GPI anchored protein n=1 Tax=Penicillium cf. griseofulvum TaxID=2972120 RepID=A0A9W9MQ87_9EURO|nr:hypothetical protein N7472_001883 [Penicillium cf. griseofulvum]KAJ5437387.1 hypothetical protein N7445_005931 [Penicillium cf. griseofulvum]KAJ5441533.1 hypothetical protein N7491_003939 [Penicillium cf. griseofulvum]